MSTPERRSPRRFLRFSLRGLMLLVLLIGAPLGWIVNRAHVQRDAVAAIARSGGHVTYNGHFKSNGLRYVNDPLRTPGWMADWVGVDYLDTITWVEIGPATVDADLVLVGRLSGLERLRIRSASITDEGLAHLSGLHRLWFLGLEGANVTGRGLVHLKAMTSLITLLLNDTQVDGAGMEHLQGLINLHS